MLSEGEELREEGIRRVSVSNREWIDVMRDIAADIARRAGTVSAVDLRLVAENTNNFPSHPNAWGAIFKTKRFEPTGEWIPCQHADGHARAVRVWRYVG